MNRNRRPSAPPACEIATLRMALLHIEPLIWRQLEVPTMMTLGALHEIIQAAMCWSDSDLWEFTVDGRRYGMPDDDDLGDEPDRQSGVEGKSVSVRVDIGGLWIIQKTKNIQKS